MWSMPLETAKEGESMTFNEWFENEARPGSLDAEFDRAMAKAAWNAAIKEAKSLVELNFDECEPWLTPEEVAALEA